MADEKKDAAVEKTAAPADPYEVMHEHLTAAIQGNAQRKAFLQALKDAIHAAIQTYHEETHE